MKRTEAEPAIRTLVHQWAEAAGIAVGSTEQPSFSAFRRWVEEQGYSGYFVSDPRWAHSKMLSAGSTKSCARPGETRRLHGQDNAMAGK